MTQLEDRNGMIVLDEASCWDLLAGASVGRLAVSIANEPDVFPVNHVVDAHSVVFRTAEGTKLAASVLGTSVAFEVDGYDPEGGQAWSVVLKGTAREIEEVEDLLRAEDLPLFPWHTSPKHRWVRIRATELTGRRFEVAHDR